MRTLSFPEAICEATTQEMARDSNVIVMGQGVDDPKAILGTTKGLVERFGPERCFDVPLAEDGILGAAVGAAIGGLRPIHVHIRCDFLLLAMNQLVNMAAKMRYMFGGSVKAPLVVRATIGKSWGQGPQHSQSIYPLLMNIPGLRVVAPTTPYDAKGILTAAIRSDDPVVYIDHRHLYYQIGLVPEDSYQVALDKGRILARGDDVTLVGISQMAVECLRAAKHLEEDGIRAEVIDPISLAPLDLSLIEESVRRTGHLIIVDNAWLPAAAGAEIIARLHEAGLRHITCQRLGFAHTVCPTTPTLEEHFYPDGKSIAIAAHTMLQGTSKWQPSAKISVEEVAFQGPF